jgi:cytochrome c oxidase assembly protein subunit 15
MRSGARADGMVLHLLVVVQITLGIATLLSGMALWIAVAHQGVAALLVIGVARCLHATGVAPAAVSRSIDTPDRQLASA